MKKHKNLLIFILNLLLYCWYDNYLSIFFPWSSLKFLQKMTIYKRRKSIISCSIIILYYYIAVFCKGGLALFCKLLLFSTTRGILCFSARGFLHFSASSLYGFFELFKLSNINPTHESAFIFSTDLQVSFFLHIRDCFTDSSGIFFI